MDQQTLSSVCVYCGSNAGIRPEYADAARELGAEIAARGIRLVYGGGAVGLMGIVAESAMTAGAHVIGVIPRSLDLREIAKRNITELHVVDSMHERKQLMERLSDGFIALPGGFGTFEELCEMLTWSQLGIHQKPVGLLNVAGYYDPLLALFDHAAAERFLHPEHRSLLLQEITPTALIDRMASFRPPKVTKWLDRTEG